MRRDVRQSLEERTRSDYTLATMRTVTTQKDTPPEVEKGVRERLMALSGSERFCMGSRMFDAARRMVLASFPEDLTETERRHRLYERIYGESHPLA